MACPKTNSAKIEYMRKQVIQVPQGCPTWDELKHLKMEPMFGETEVSTRHFLSAGTSASFLDGAASDGRAKQPILGVLPSRSAQRLGRLLAHMYLLEVLVKLPLHGSHCCFRISGQSRPAKCEVCVAT